MSNESNNPHILGGSSPPEECPRITSQVTVNSEWLTSKEAACYLRCSLKTLYNYKCAGKLKCENRGGTKNGQLLFKKSILDNFVSGKRG